MEVKRLKEIYPDWNQGLNWSGFAHTAQANYAYARIAMQASSPSLAITLSHQMIELCIKACILYCICESDFNKYELIRKKYGHNTITLLEDFKTQIPMFSEVLKDKEKVNFIEKIVECYVDARFGEVHSIIEARDCLILDNVFQSFMSFLYNKTKVPSLSYLMIPSGTRKFFANSLILDFNHPSCKDFGSFIGNIRIVI